MSRGQIEKVLTPEGKSRRAGFILFIRLLVHHIKKEIIIMIIIGFIPILQSSKLQLGK